MCGNPEAFKFSKKEDENTVIQYIKNTLRTDGDTEKD